MRDRGFVGLVVALLVVGGLLAAGVGPAVGDEPGTGSVKGTVTFDGTPPAPKKQKVTQDEKTCGHEVVSEEAVISADGKLANVVIWLDGGTEMKNKKARGELTNKGCRFVPHVTAVQMGGRVKVLNDDPLLHNAHFYYLGKKTIANIALPDKGMSAEVKIKKPGPYVIKCDAGHTWMLGYVYGVPTPWFAVSGADGTFAIAGVPAGKYKAKAWHEAFGEREAEVTVAAGGEASVEFMFAAK